ncbi:MAG: hypothetical protein AAFX01_14365 [Cyanobacteria bacterium J06638_28]
MKNFLLLALSLPISLVATGQAIAQIHPITQGLRSVNSVLPHEQTYHPDQLNPPATLEHLYAYRPACRQLENRNSSNGFKGWGMNDQRGQFHSWYGLPGDLAEPEAFNRLDEVGLCVINGQIVEMISPIQRSQLLAELNSFAQTSGEDAAHSLTTTNGLDPNDPFDANRLRAQQLRNGGVIGNVEPSENGGGMVFLIVVGIIIYLQWPNIQGFLNSRMLARFSGLSSPVPASASPVPDTVPRLNDQQPVDAAGDTGIPPTGGDIRTAVQVVLGSPNLSRAFFGGQRTGKTNLVATCTRELKKLGYTIIHINLASYCDGEVMEDKTYWQHADISVVCDLVTSTSAQVLKAIADAKAAVKLFNDTPSRAILVVDEWKYTTIDSNQYADELSEFIADVANQVSGLDSTGVKRKKAIYTIAPGIVAKTTVKDGLCVKNLAPSIVGITPGKFVEWDGQKISFSYEVLEQVNNNYGSISIPKGSFTCDRICFIDGSWRPLGGAELSTNLPVSAPIRTAVSPTGEEISPATEKHQTDLALAMTEARSYPGLDIFVLWLGTRKETTIRYEDFRNANRCKQLPRDRGTFLELCDVACFKGLLSNQGDDQFYVLL